MPFPCRRNIQREWYPETVLHSHTRESKPAGGREVERGGERERERERAE